jgi:hypothetical protein
MMLAATDAGFVQYRLLVHVMLPVTVVRIVRVVLTVTSNIETAEILGGPLFEVYHF